MKGTLFSADFVEDSNGNLRLIEINTDTQPPTQTLPLFDFSEFISVLEDNNITSVTIVNKPNLHSELVQHLSQSLNVSASFVNEFITINESPNTIYPTNVEDGENKFILRMAYDETAIFDSEYAKGTLNLLKLFYEGGESGSAVEFYHSSSFEELNSIVEVLNSSNLPDVVVKNITEDHKMAKFYKIGSELENENDIDRWTNFISKVRNENNIIQKYHINTESLTNDKVNSIRTFSIIYGFDLNLINLAQYKMFSIFTLPTGSIYDESLYVNELDAKHFYEFATNYVKFEGSFDGILDRHLLIKGDGTEVEAGLIEVGDTLKSYYLGSSSLNEETGEYLSWQISGSSFPSDSYLTSSVVVYKNSKPLEKKTLILLNVNNNIDNLYVAPNKSFLVYDSLLGVIVWKPSINVIPVTDYLLDYDGDTAQVTKNEVFITNDNGLNLIEIDCEETDTYIIAGTTPINSFITHNAPCFVAGTKISLADGSIKNIEDIKPGDVVSTFDLKSDTIVQNEVNTVFSKKVNTTVEYILENGEVLNCTLDHPIYVSGKGWSSYSAELSNLLYSLEHNIKNVEVGDSVKLFNGLTKIIDIKVINEEIVVYNLQDIQNNHNFFANNVLVHNRFCFVGETKITLQNNEIKNIEEIEVGDFVLSFDEKNNQQEYNKVLKVFKPMHDDLVEYTLSNGEKIVSTFDHPYYVNGLNLASYSPEYTNNRYEFLENVTKIQLGDKLNSVNGEEILIVEIKEMERVLTQTYIFTVENTNNFYANNILVHNK